MSARPTNLPLQLTSFIGRQQELSRVLGTIDIELNPRSGEQIEYRHQ